LHLFVPKKKGGEVLVRMEYFIPHGEVEEKDWWDCLFFLIFSF
jgi:hypothetical protein